MRLALGLLGAVVCHGLALGVGLALIPSEDVRARAAAALDVDVIPARPDPVAPAVPTESRRPARHVRARPTPLPPPTTEPAPPPGPPAPAPAATALPASVSPTESVRATRPPGPAMTVPPTEQARYRTNPPPDYPRAARLMREEGIVRVRVAVGADGLPGEVTVERSCGHPLLDDAAVQAVRRWTFEPARAAGTPIASLVVVPVRFSLVDSR